MLEKGLEKEQRKESLRRGGLLLLLGEQGVVPAEEVLVLVSAQGVLARNECLEVSSF